MLKERVIGCAYMQEFEGTGMQNVEETNNEVKLLSKNFLHCMRK